MTRLEALALAHEALKTLYAAGAPEPAPDHDEPTARVLAALAAIPLLDLRAFMSEGAPHWRRKLAHAELVRRGVDPRDFPEVKELLRRYPDVFD